MTLQQLKEEARANFKKDFGRISELTRGDFVFSNAEGNRFPVSKRDGKYTNNQWDAVDDFIDSLITKAYEQGKKSKKESLDKIIEAMRNENRLDNDIVISEGRLRDYIEKYFII